MGDIAKFRITNKIGVGQAERGSLLYIHVINEDGFADVTNIDESFFAVNDNAYTLETDRKEHTRVMKKANIVVSAFKEHARENIN
ncbi:hypothetical protein MT391_10620 [Vibrio sp. 1-Bac 57]